MKKTRSLLLNLPITVLVVVPTLVSAATKSVVLPTHWAAMTAAAPTIDGDLSDKAWSDAASMGPFLTMSGKDVLNRAVGKVTWDAKNLYIAVDMQQSGADQLPPTGMKRDGDIYMKDCVEVFIDSKLDFRTYFHLLVNPENIQRDEKGDIGGTPSFDVKFDAAWQSATKRTKDGWTVEIAIPLFTLGLDGRKENVIGLNLCRNDTQSGQLSCWSPTGSGFHVPSHFGMVALVRESRKPSVEINLSNKAELQPGASVGKATVKNLSSAPLDLEMEAKVGSSKALWKGRQSVRNLAPSASAMKSVDCKIRDTGPHALGLVARDVSNRRVLGVAGLAFSIPISLSQNFGYRLPSPKGLDLWWAESTYKVMKKTPVPARQTKAVTLSAARREWEPFQLVLHSPQPLTNVTVSVSDFRRGSSVIPSSAFRLMKVEYIPVDPPTDAFGSVDDYPDPLPPLTGTFDVAANENSPVWVLAHVPADAAAGEYTGQVSLRAKGVDLVQVPVKLRVFDFTLTEETHTRTAYGLGLDTAFLGLKDDRDQEVAWENHLNAFREHRLSPYGPMQRHPMKYEIEGPRWTISNGPLQLVCDKFSNQYFKINWKGKPLGALTNTIEQFEKEGVGWKGTGISWPGISHLKEVRILDRNPKRWILEVTGEFVGSSPANRGYEITFQFYVPAGQPWFAARMVRFKNSDQTRFRLGGFFHILSSSIEKPQVVNGNGYALWIGDGRAVGAISASTDMRFDPAPIYIQKQVWLDPGQETEGFGPTMVFFAGDASSADEAKALLERVRASWGQQDPSAWMPTGDNNLTVSEKQDITVTHDFADFDKHAAKYLDGWKFNGFTFGDVPETLAGFKKGTPDYMRLHALIYGKQAEHLREKGWLDEAYSYWKDEPTEEEYDFVNQGMDILKQSCPGLTRLLTEQVEDKLVGHVDLWTPVLSNYDPKKCQARQKAGDHVWWYVCCGPGAPYPNNFIDHPAINHRIRYWMIEKYGVEGDLYWATTFYYRENYKQRNPWEHGMSVSPDGGYWGNGDGMLLYPACRKPNETPITDPPVVSQRIELIREGLEDLEYFWTLKQEMKELETRLPSLPASKQAQARKLLERGQQSLAAPDRLAKSLTEYTKDPQDLLREREKVAEVIESMERLSK